MPAEQKEDLMDLDELELALRRLASTQNNTALESLLNKAFPMEEESEDSEESTESSEGED